MTKEKKPKPKRAAAKFVPLDQLDPDINWSEGTITIEDPCILIVNGHFFHVNPKKGTMKEFKPTYLKIK